MNSEKREISQILFEEDHQGLDTFIRNIGTSNYQLCQQ